MKKRIYPLFCLTVLLLTVSCKKSFLDVPPKDVVLRQAYVTDLKTLGDYLNGVYVQLGASFYHGMSQIYPEVVADNAKPTGTRLSAHYNWIQQANEERLTLIGTSAVNTNAVWLTGYAVARDCNFVIENVDKFRDENPLLSDNIKGQAYAIRAMVYFFMTNTFAQSYNFTPNGTHPGIPYIKSTDRTLPIARISVGEFYSHLLEDLNQSVTLLPEVSPNKFVVNRKAAKALLARVYLFMENYAAAKALAREIVTTIPIMVNTPSNKMYPDSLYRKGETEALFQLLPSAQGVPAGAGDHFTFYAGWFYAPTVRFNATSDIASILRENMQDVRNVWVVPSGANWLVRKFPTAVVPGFSATAASYYHTVCRSSEMCLTAAECYAKLGNEDSARYYLNAIRLRANSTITPTIATGTALMDSIYKERRKEMAFEGIRMFDLLRWKKGVTRIDAIPGIQNLPYPSNKAIAPLPLTDVLMIGLSQNPDY